LEEEEKERDDVSKTRVPEERQEGCSQFIACWKIRPRKEVVSLR